MVPGKKEQGPLVVKTVAKIPSSNAAVANMQPKKKVVVKRKGRKPFPLQLTSASTVSSSDKKGGSAKGDKSKEVSKENEKKFFGLPTGLKRLSSNPIKFLSRSNQQQFGLPFKSRRHNSDIGHSRGTATEASSWKSSDESEESVSLNTLPFNVAGMGRKHVAFTKEAIETDRLNKERKRLRSSFKDPLGLLSRMFCSGLPFSVHTEQHSLCVRGA